MLLCTYTSKSCASRTPKLVSPVKFLSIIFNDENHIAVIQNYGLFYMYSPKKCGNVHVILHASHPQHPFLQPVDIVLSISISYTPIS